MPFTLYHLGPALLVALVFPSILDVKIFLIASIFLDFEPLLIILLNKQIPLHGIFHSITIGTIIGIILSIIINIYLKYVKNVNLQLQFNTSLSLKETVLTTTVGVWQHVILDAFIYDDLNLFYPIKWNPLYGLLTLLTIQKVCVISFALAIIVFFFRRIAKWFEAKASTQKTTLKESKTSPEEEPLFIIPEFFDNNFEEEPSTSKADELVYMVPSNNNSTPIFNDDVSQITVSNNVFEEYIPEIFIGSEKPSLQWGIIGKSDNTPVGVDLNEPHIIFVSGKQGSGKSYTIGVLSEMLLTTSIPNLSQVQNPATIIVFHKPREDMRSEFWSIVHPNQEQKEKEILLKDYYTDPQHVIDSSKLRIFVDPFVYINERIKFEKDYRARVYPIGINPQKLTAEDWPYVLSIGKKSGSIYVKKIFQIIKKTQYFEDFGLNMIKKHVDGSDLNPNQKSFALMRLDTLQDYLEAGDFLEKLVIGGVNIFDLRKIMMEPDDIFSVMMLVISAILNNKNTEKEQFVFVINEAHDYLRKGLNKDFTDYINYLVRKKRHAGTWLLLDTHFPEDVDPKIIKGSDIKILHKCDVISSNLLYQIVEGTPIPPHQLQTGQAIIRSDKSNIEPDKLLLVNIRPRITHHGGATKTAV
jgi:hypothetical protein